MRAPCAMRKEVAECLWSSPRWNSGTTPFSGSSETAVRSKRWPRPMGCQRQSVHAWLARSEDGGLAALADRSHRPRTSPLQMEPAVEARVLELRRRHLGWGKVRLRHQLEREGTAPPSLLAAPDRRGERLADLSALADFGTECPTAVPTRRRTDAPLDLRTEEMSRKLAEVVDLPGNHRSWSRVQLGKETPPTESEVGDQGP